MENLKISKGNANVSSKTKNVTQKIKEFKSIVVCHCFADVFQEMTKFSLQLQKENFVLPSTVNTLEEILSSINPYRTC